MLIKLIKKMYSSSSDIKSSSDHQTNDPPPPSEPGYGVARTEVGTSGSGNLIY